MIDKKSYEIEPIPAMRRFAFDAGYLGRRRHIVHGLIEVDITKVRNLISEYERETGEKLSLTAFIIFCLSKSIEEHPHVHAYRDWRRLCTDRYALKEKPGSFNRDVLNMHINWYKKNIKSILIELASILFTGLN